LFRACAYHGHELVHKRACLTLVCELSKLAQARIETTSAHKCSCLALVLALAATNLRTRLGVPFSRLRALLGPIVATGSCTSALVSRLRAPLWAKLWPMSAHNKPACLKLVGEPVTQCGHTGSYTCALVSRLDAALWPRARTQARRSRARACPCGPLRQPAGAQARFSHACARPCGQLACKRMCPALVRKRVPIEAASSRTSALVSRLCAPLWLVAATSSAHTCARPCGPLRRPARAQARLSRALAASRASAPVSRLCARFWPLEPTKACAQARLPCACARPSNCKLASKRAGLALVCVLVAYCSDRARKHACRASTLVALVPALVAASSCTSVPVSCLCASLRLIEAASSRTSALVLRLCAPLWPRARAQARRSRACARIRGSLQ